MQFATVFAILAAATSVSAGVGPNYGNAAAGVQRNTEMRTRPAAAQCGNHQKLSCCDSGDSADEGLGAGILKNVLGGNCDQIPINIIGANGILQQACGSNQAACCTGDMNGLVNVACDPIQI